MDDNDIVLAYLAWELFLEEYKVDTDFICPDCDGEIRMDEETLELSCDGCSTIFIQDAQ